MATQPARNSAAARQRIPAKTVFSTYRDNAGAVDRERRKAGAGADGRKMI